MRYYKTVSGGGVWISLHKILIKGDRDRFKLPSLWAHKRAKKWLFLKNEWGENIHAYQCYTNNACANARLLWISKFVIRKVLLSAWFFILNFRWLLSAFILFHSKKDQVGKKHFPFEKCIDRNYPIRVNFYSLFDHFSCIASWINRRTQQQYTPNKKLNHKLRTI